MQYYFGCFLFINNNLQQKDMVVYIIYNDSNINRGELMVYVWNSGEKKLNSYNMT